MIAHVPGEGHLVGHHQHGHPFPRKRPHDVQHLAHHLRVQRGGGFVEQQYLRVHSQRPGNGYPLLLAAGDLPGLGVDVGRHAHLFQIGHRVSPGFLTAPLQHLHLTDHAVFQHRHIVEQIEGLKHHTHMGAVGRRVDAPPGHVLAVVADLAGGGRFQQVDAPKQRAFSGAGGADDGGHVALINGKVDVPENLMASERLGKVVDL